MPDEINTTPPPAVDPTATQGISGLDIEGLSQIDMDDPGFQAIAQAFLNGTADGGEFLNRGNAPTSDPGASSQGAALPPATDSSVPTPDAGTVGVSSDGSGDAALPPPTRGAAPPVPPAPLPPPDVSQQQPPPAPPSSYDVQLPDGSSYALSNDDMQQLLGLNQWAAGLTPQQREAMTAVEEGRSIPIPLDEYTRYQEWQKGQTTQSTQGQTYTVDPNAFEDPHAAQAIAALNQEITRLRSSITDLSSRPDPTTAATHVLNQHEAARQKVERDAQIINQVATTYAQEHSLSDEDIRALQQTIRDEQIFGAQMARHKDITAATRASFDKAMRLNDTIYQRSVDAQVQAKLDAERTDLAVTDAKKARAASLASVPSAAVTLPPRDPNAESTPQQIEAEIAKFVRELGEGAMQ